MAENTVREQRKTRGKPFAAGQSGNPSGRPAGARNHSTVAIEALLEGEALALGRKAIEMALRGDGMAMKLCLERVAPVRRGRPVRFSLDPIITADDVTRALGAVLQATATGDLTPDEASTVANIMEAKRRSIEVVELEKRLAALEAAATSRGLR
jgi:Family of unknown function (DUF5681)